MLLPGRIESTTLGDVLGALHREHVTGALELQEPSGVIHRVHFRGGSVSAVETPIRLPLGRVLSDMGVLSESARRALDALSVCASEEPIGERLVDGSHISGATLAVALRVQLRRRLAALCEVRRGRLIFRPSVRAQSEPVPMSTREFLHGWPRKRQTTDHDKAPGRDVRERHEALAVLGLAEDADPAQVRSAFRRLASEMHPDRRLDASPDEREALAERFARASAAYHLLVA
jgi:DnaJ-domain-containing protein 1